jgi:hypothetical protein
LPGGRKVEPLPLPPTLQLFQKSVLHWEVFYVSKSARNLCSDGDPLLLGEAPTRSLLFNLKDNVLPRNFWTLEGGTSGIGM